MPVADFELIDSGDGRFALRGEMSFETSERILAASEAPFEQHTQIEVDLSEVSNSDSAGLALLLEWVTWANHTVREIRFIEIPERITAIAARPFTMAGTPTELSLSVGVAVADDAQSGPALFSLAEKAMLETKATAHGSWMFA